MTSAAISGKTTYSRQSDTELVATRVFDAPRELVFDAHTRPEHVKQWLLGPDGWTMPICEIDLRPGGKWRYVWRNASGGDEFSMSGEFTEVNRPSRIVSTERFNDNPSANTNINDFTEENGRTTMKLTIRTPSKEILDGMMATGMTGGMDISYDRLDSILSKM
jgi:uncharacterized protein YndB with AHSA1/START domain